MLSVVLKTPISACGIRQGIGFRLTVIGGQNQPRAQYLLGKRGNGNGFIVKCDRMRCIIKWPLRMKSEVRGSHYDLIALIEQLTAGADTIDHDRIFTEIFNVESVVFGPNPGLYTRYMRIVDNDFTRLGSAERKFTLAGFIDRIRIILVDEFETHNQLNQLRRRLLGGI